MSHEGTLTLLGILTVLAPFLGLPYSWLMVIIPILGLAIVALSVLLRARSMSEVPAEHTPEPIAQSLDETPSVLA